MKFPQISVKKKDSKFLFPAGIGLLARLMNFGRESRHSLTHSGGASPYVPGVPGHTQFLAQIRVKTYVGTPSFLRGHTQFLSLNVPENAGAHPLSKT